MVHRPPTQSALIDVPDASGSLARETNWWGAFVIGLAGTVLIISLIGYALYALGGFAIVLFAIITAIGVFLCFCLAEMAATWPERAGGLPSYAFETFKPVGNGVSRHVGGLSSWAYWLGWFTVAPINAFLAALYIVDLFNIDFGPDSLPPPRVAPAPSVPPAGASSGRQLSDQLSRVRVCWGDLDVPPTVDARFTTAVRRRPSCANT
mgnify:CR=1 FL=1